jgi:hypothetical protein
MSDDAAAGSARRGSPWFARTSVVMLAVATAAAPPTVLTGALLNPAIGGSAQANLAANASASATNVVHIAAFMAATFLLPLNVIGLALTGLPGAPRLAVAGGLLGVLGWMPFAALTAQDDLTRQLAHTSGYDRYAPLWQRFTTGPVMLTFLVVYAVGHLIAYTLLGIALLPARPVPRWAAWAIVVANPIQIVAFVVHPLTRVLLAVGILALAAGCLAAARALLTMSRTAPRLDVQAVPVIGSGRDGWTGGRG